MVASNTALAAADVAVDHELAQVSDRFRFLLDVTPVNAVVSRQQFLDDGRIPVFSYRALEDDPDVLAAMLDGIDVGKVEDASLGHLLRAKARELELQVEMLRARETDDFLPLSIELYGTVSPGLLRKAESILDSITAPATSPSGSDWIDAPTFAAMAEEELDHYRAIDPDIGVHVEVRPDAAGVMVSGPTLLVSTDTRLSRQRAWPLLQHEVGTHLVTHVNGSYQPLRLLASGLAGYEETQEGLAVLAELLVGGLTANRIRQLAGRVLAVHQMVGGATFAEVHRSLLATGFAPGGAFTTAMRVFRSGGLTKDAIYLRGLLDLVDHLGDGHDLDVLLLGKVSLEGLPLVGDLLDRGILNAPRLRPRYLDNPEAAARLDYIAEHPDLSHLYGSLP